MACLPCYNNSPIVYIGMFAQVVFSIHTILIHFNILYEGSNVLTASFNYLYHYYALHSTIIY